MNNEAKIADYLTNQLSEYERVAFEKAMSNDNALRQEVEELQTTWKALQNAEQEADATMDADFYELLSQEQNLQKPFVKSYNPVNVFWQNNIFKAAAAIIGLGLAFGIGRLSAPDRIREIVIREPQSQQNTSQSPTNILTYNTEKENFKHQKQDVVKQIVTLQKEIQITQELLVFTLLKNNSASDRIKGLSLVLSTQKPDVKLLSELLKIMRQDESLNVRLSAIETLGKFDKDTKITNSFVAQLSQSNEPIEQASLIESLVRLRATESIGTLKDIEKNEKIDQSVRFLAKNSISELELLDNQITQQP
jgi:hypothetical protein